MVAAILPDNEFVEAFESVGPRKLSKRLGCSFGTLMARRRRLEVKIGRQIKAPDAIRNTRHAEEKPHRIHLDIPNGQVLIGSDAHYWPGEPSTAHRGFVKFLKDLRPRAVIMNGDVFDGATVSRHAPIGWESRPSVIQEMEACQERLGEIEQAAGKARKVWTLGNHDARFETRLATVAPEFARVNGVHLRDHFPDWEPSWSAWINDDVVVKHRFKSGIHAPHNNTMWAGKSMVTGHLHSLKVMPITDYRGTRWGVDCGTLAEPGGKQFVDYTEDNPVSWRSGFVVLTFHKGRLLQPQTAMVIGPDEIDFCGKVCRV